MADGSFLNPEEERLLVKLIADTEHQTTGEIRIHIEKHVSKHGIMADAAKVFHQIKMHETKERNGVLIHIALKDHDLAVIGDSGIHRFIGDQGWRHIVDDLRAAFTKGDFYLGLSKAIEEVGKVLKEHFPLRTNETNPNELSNEISKGE